MRKLNARKNNNVQYLCNYAVQGCLSKNYLTRKIIARNILDTKYSQFIVNLVCFQVLLEILRLYPPAPGTSRETTSDDLKLSGYTIPRGTIITISYTANHYNPEHWDDPETFDPSRFNPDRGK